MLYAVLGALMEKAAAVLRSEATSGAGAHASVQRTRTRSRPGRRAAAICWPCTGGTWPSWTIWW
jgi:hypothetical protein